MPQKKIFIGYNLAMKVNAISFYTMGRAQGGISCAQKKSESIKNEPPKELHKPLSQSLPIYFGANIKIPRIDSYPKEIMIMKEIPGMPCFFCGVKTIPQKIYDTIELMSKPKMRSLESFFAMAQQVGNTLLPDDAKIITTIKEENKKLPHLSLPELLKKINYKPTKNVDKIIYRKATPTEYSRESIRLIKKYENCLFPIEQKVFKIIRTYHKKNHEASLQKIMADLRPKYLKILTKKQNSVLKKIDRLAMNLPDEDKNKIHEATINARNMIIDDSSQDPFKRQEFIVTIGLLTKELQNKELASKIRQEVIKLPSSSNNLSAFIIKYSGKVQVIERQEVKQSFENLLSLQEKKVANEIMQSYKNTYPGESLGEILIKIKDTHAANLEKTRNLVFADLKKTSKTLSRKFDSTIFSITNGIREELNKPNQNPEEIRQKLLSGIRELRNVVDDRHLKIIMKKAYQMPHSKNNINALIVKCQDELEVTNANKYKIENILNPEESIIFEKIKRQYLTNNNEKSLKEIINASKQDIFKDLKEEQNALLDDIDALAQGISKKIEQVLVNLIEEFNTKEPKKFMNEVKKIVPIERKHAKVFQKLVLKLPLPENNIDAFVVTYANNIPVLQRKNVRYEFRSDREIAQSLLRRAVVNVEHKKAQTEWGMKNKAMNHLGNLTFTHEYCNGKKGHTHLDTYFQKYPEQIENPQKQMDFIIDKINNGTLKGAYHYPSAAKKTDFKESNGIIKLDISRLKKRQERWPFV